MRPAERTPDELLRRARARAEPDVGEAGRVLSRLQAQISTASGGEASRELAGSGRWLTPALRRALLGTAGAMLLGVGFLLGRLSTVPSAVAPFTDDSSAVAPNTASALAAASGSDAATGSGATSSPSSSSSSGASTPASSAAPSLAEPPVRLGARAVRPRAPAREHTATGSLNEALRRLRLAQRALYERDAGRALAVLDDLDRRIPLAVLGEEREMTRILALCAQGEFADARALAQSWTAEHPQSVYLARLQNSCVDANAVTPAGVGLPARPE